MRYDGIHISTPEELVKRADVCLLAITQIEFDTIKGVLLNPEEITISSPDLRRVIVGFRGNTVCVVAQAMAKRAIRAYGSAMALFPLVESCRFFYKVGGAAGRHEIGTKIGTIVILCRGNVYIWRRQQRVAELPSPTHCQLSK